MKDGNYRINIMSFIIDSLYYVCLSMHTPRSRNIYCGMWLLYVAMTYTVKLSSHWLHLEVLDET